jgi:hypothetical protein
MAFGVTDSTSIAATITTDMMLTEVLKIVAPEMPFEGLMQTVDAKGKRIVEWNYAYPIDRAVIGSEVSEPAPQKLDYGNVTLAPRTIEQAVNITELAKLTTFVPLEEECRDALALSYKLRYNMEITRALREAAWCYIPQGAAGSAGSTTYFETPAAHTATRIAHVGDLEVMQSYLRDELWMNSVKYNGELQASHNKLLYITTATGAASFKTATEFETWNTYVNPELYYGFEAGTLAGFIICEVHDTQAIDTNLGTTGCAEAFILGSYRGGKAPLIRALWRAEDVFLDYIGRAKKQEIWTINSIQNMRLRTYNENDKGLVLCVKVTTQ